MSSLFVIVFILAVLFAIVGIFAAIKALKKPTQPASFMPTREDPLASTSGAGNFGPQILGPGAVVTRNGHDYVVRGSISYRQGPYVWWSHLFDNGEWLGVEVDEGILQLTWWRSRKDLYGLTGSSSVSADGLSFNHEETGSAVYTSEGTTGVAPSGNMEFQDYASGSLLLSLENYDGAGWEVSTGETIGQHELTVYPAPTS
ncbi:DUF4178 domain-containing protein [Corynebacterium freiburgense]|uniref:DUF4178 domain-containing protein n=1 Tax=Corynebacterium freiburgense TaxID=556548 RepID=UPI00041A80B1|nr:DUF4178 domain-containing protein [Corynebacterium freiburgense]WJZ02295.1 hypothetical protein CFREI_04995 [Corynebacterium freiburgense]